MCASEPWQERCDSVLQLSHGLPLLSNRVLRWLDPRRLAYGIGLCEALRALQQMPPTQPGCRCPGRATPITRMPCIGRDSPLRIWYIVTVSSVCASRPGSHKLINQLTLVPQAAGLSGEL